MVLSQNFYDLKALHCHRSDLKYLQITNLHVKGL